MVNLMTLTVQGVSLPDSKLARETTELVRDTASPLLFHHSSRVYYFGALAGNHRGLSFDPEPFVLSCIPHVVPEVVVLSFAVGVVNLLLAPP